MHVTTEASDKSVADDNCGNDDCGNAEFEKIADLCETFDRNLDILENIDDLVIQASTRDQQDIEATSSPYKYVAFGDTKPKKHVNKKRRLAFLSRLAKWRQRLFRRSKKGKQSKNLNGEDCKDTGTFEKSGRERKDDTVTENEKKHKKRGGISWKGKDKKNNANIEAKKKVTFADEVPSIGHEKNQEKTKSTSKGKMARKRVRRAGRAAVKYLYQGIEETSKCKITAPGLEGIILNVDIEFFFNT